MEITNVLDALQLYLSQDNEATKFADLYFFGPRGEIVVGKEALTLLSSIRGQANTVPQNLLAIVGK